MTEHSVPSAQLESRQLFVQVNEDNPNIQKFYQYFSTKGEKPVINQLTEFSPYFQFVSDILEERGFSWEYIFLAYVESHFKIRARSHVNAVGLWQFMNGTGRLVGLDINETIDERKDIFSSTVAFTKHFKYLLNYYDNIELALAAYNCGQGRLDAAIKKGKSRDFWFLVKKGLIPKETALYVPKFLGLVLWARANENRIKAITNEEHLFIVYKVFKDLNIKKVLHNNLNYLSYIRKLNNQFKTDILPAGSKVLINYTELNLNLPLEMKRDLLDYFEIYFISFPKKSLADKASESDLFHSQYASHDQLQQSDFIKKSSLFNLFSFQKSPGQKQLICD